MKYQDQTVQEDATIKNNGTKKLIKNDDTEQPKEIETNQDESKI